MVPWVRGAGHRLKSLLKFCFSGSKARKERHSKKTTRQIGATDGRPPTLLPIPPNDLSIVVLPPSPPTIVEKAQTPSSNSHGLSPHPNAPVNTMVQPKAARPLQPINTRSNLVPVSEDEVNPNVDENERVDRDPRSKALLIGVHYKTQNRATGWGELDTPGDDVKRVRDLLHSRGYTEFRTLVDTNDPHRDGMPTLEGIRDGLHWLIDDARPGDRLFLHYSGHGDQVPTDDTSETDGKNEAIVPLNPYDTEETLIIDDELHNILVKPLPHGCTLIALFDCCHSGTMLDLSHKFPHYGFTRRNLKKRMVRDWARLRNSHPVRLARSLPTMALKRNGSIPVVQPQGPAKPPARRGSYNPLKLPHVVEGSPSTSANSGPTSISSTDSHPLVVPHAPFVDEPRGNSLTSHRSTESSTQSNVPSPHVAFPTPPHSAAIERQWIQEEITTTPKSAAFNHEQIAAPPIIRDFQSHYRGFSQIKSPTLEDPKQVGARVIAIAACLDEEEAIDINKLGGLLTSTFVDCMNEPAHRDGVTLGNMISYFGECFKIKTKELHDGHTPAVDGKCGFLDCLLPVKAPKPLVTSSVKLMHDVRIVL